MTEGSIASFSPQAASAALAQFSALRVLVIGDLFMDEYIEGEMYEISKEGPIPVIRRESSTQAAGAAGNLAASLRNLGAAVTVIGIIGAGARGRTLLSQLEAKGIDTKGIIATAELPTFTYTKIRARVENAPSREVLRLDVLPSLPLSPALEGEVLEKARSLAVRADGIIVLDQIRHLITPALLDELPSLARACGALLHGSSRDHIGDFHDFDLITPNDREARGAAGGGASDAGSLGQRLKERGRHRQILLTLGAEGMALFPASGPMLRLPSYAEEVVDVTGAGDAVSATAMLGNILGWSLPQVAWTASQAAAIAISKVGTHHVSREELAAWIEGRAAATG
jgi:rfaE bifunctional protein kinase chain/domain